jgi:hypothetical protein
MSDLRSVFLPFVQHFVAAFLLAVLAMAVYAVGRLFVRFSSKLLLEIPFGFTVFMVRWYLGILGLRRELRQGLLSNVRQADSVARKLDRWLGWLERRLARVRNGKQPLAAVLFEEGALAADVSTIESQSIRRLESDKSLVEALSNDVMYKQRGVLNLSANPLLQPYISDREELAVLIVVLRQGGSPGSIARYHLFERLRAMRADRVTEVTKAWPAQIREEIQKATEALSA